MPIVCIPRPNRSRARTFDARAVGRIYCHALEDGESPAEIEKYIDACMQKRGQVQGDVAIGQVQVSEAADQAAEEAQIAETFEQVRNAMLIALALLLAVRALPFIIRLLPAAALRLVPKAARAAVTSAEKAIPIITAEFRAAAETIRIRIGSAANDPAWREFFRKVSGL